MEMIKMRDKGIWKILAISMVFVTIGSCAAMASVGGVRESDRNSSSATIYVPDNYSKIQAAVNAASPGDIIIVRDGTYSENIEVDKSLTIRSENGPDSTIVQTATAGVHVFNATADYVKISGFTVEGATGEIVISNASGICLYCADYCNISDNKCSNNRDGIFLSNSNNNSISNNKGSNILDGIYLEHSNNNSIFNNDCSGISLKNSNNNSISNSKGSNILDGIYLEHSNNNSIFNNDCSGISLKNSNNNSISNNKCSNNFGIYLENSNNNSISNNDCLGHRDNGIHLRYSNNNSMSNNKCSSNNDDGIHLRYSHNNSISNNKCSNNWDRFIHIGPQKNVHGICLDNSNNNTISNNNCFSNGNDGIRLDNSKDSSISNNNCSRNSNGIYLDYSDSNSVSNNNCSNNRDDGIYLRSSDSNSISNNNCSNNRDGIHLRDSKNNKLTGNIMVDNGIVIGGDWLNDYAYEIDESNTVNGKPVYYWKDVEGGRIPEGAGQVILVNCTNISIEKQNLNNASIGIQIAFSSYISIKNNNCSNNRKYGISLRRSDNNLIYLNNFLDNADNVRSYESPNIWNTPKKITYTYNETTYTNYLGNYWDNYTGTDADGDGIGDTPSSIDTDKDNYPLMEPWKNYAPTPAPTIIYVTDDYGTIQAAVNAASAGDIIIARDGTYIENIDVEKRLTIKSENGSENCIVHAAKSYDHVFEVRADHVNISGFLVKGATYYKKAGIYLKADYCNMSNNNCLNNRDGIYLSGSNNSSISNNNCSSNNRDGIYLRDSNNNSISNNNCSNDEDGICLSRSNNNSISNNNCSNNWHGICLRDSNNNCISNNNCFSNNRDGICFRDSKNNKLTGNVMIENGIFIGGYTRKHYTHEIDESNTVNGKPVYYWKDVEGRRVPEGAGQVILVNCSNVIVENQNLNNASVGIQIAFSSCISIKNNNCSSNNWDGIYLADSHSNSMSNNNCSDNWHGISLRDSNYNSISNNNCSSNNRDGIYLEDSNHNSISNNNCSNNRDGVYLVDSVNNKLTGNIMIENGIFIDGYSRMHYMHEIDTSNTVNGKPVYNWKNTHGGKIPDGAGQVILASCSNIIVENQNLNNASVGIEVAFSYYITIKNNNCSNNDNGIYLKDSDNNNISNNNCSNNGDKGIYLDDSNNNSISNNNCSSNNREGISIRDSNNNSIYLNNFIDNTDNVYSFGSTNTWNSTKEITYTYNETTHTNYLGNYWSDYYGNDTNNDGIGDTPYSIINSDKDNYPLMQPWQNYFSEENETIKNTNPKLAFSSYYQPINISVNLRVPPYPLPLNLSNVTNTNEINAKFWLSEREEELLRTNGFVIIDYGNEDDIVAPYKDMKMRGVPIFVTADTLLHLYHIQFNEILKGIEEREFFDKLVDVSKAMLEQSTQDYENFVDPEMKEAARRNVAYFAVALKLLQTPTEGYDEERLKREIEEWNTKYPWDKKTFKPIKKVEFEIPDYVKDDVDNEIENIGQHDGFHPSVIFNSDSNCLCGYPCCYCEDYSQYVPRGHYTRSEKLKRYFNAMMWYGRMAFLLKGGDGALISEQDAKISTIQAALISSELPDVNVDTKTAQETWDRIYTVTAFFVGTADDLTPYEYRNAINDAFGAEFNASELSTEDNLLELKVELAKLRSPEIYGGSGVCVVYPPITKEDLYKCLNKTKGMRFMGQRFVPDSYMFQQLVSPAVGMYVGNNTPFTMCRTPAGPARCFPRGLDIMAVLGSERAEAILIEEGDTEYAGVNTSYDKQLEELKSQFAGFDFNITEWNRNLYWSWLYSLKPLLKQFGDGYPTFMQTKAWQEKALQTSLASWTELRHDTILYAKQSYTPELEMSPQPKPVRGYVEPVPEFYARLLALTKMTGNGLVDLDVLDETEKARLQRLERILERLINISKAELENKELTEDDYEFIRNFGENLDSVVAGVNTEGKETTIVADVHTDCNTGNVLEEGVGYVNLILVAYTVPDGRIIVGAGPVFSYYEFKQPMDDRLTDEKWKEMLRSNPPEKPGWVRGIEADW